MLIKTSDNGCITRKIFKYVGKYLINEMEFLFVISEHKTCTYISLV